MIRDPQAAVAASICYLARWRGIGDGVTRAAVGMRHPRECEWCAYPAEELVRWVQEFNRADRAADWALSAAFRRLSNEAQRRMVDETLYPKVAA